MMIADASVWINLIASCSVKEILIAVGEPVLITDVALGELDRGRRKGRKAGEEVRSLVQRGLAQRIPLNSADEALFLALVSGSASETLDDGEAATLACADRLGACALIDERKATSLAARRLPHLCIRATTDILLASSVRRALDDVALADALYNALVDARMRVPDRHIDEIIRLIGAERASRCLSLPVRWRSKTHDCPRPAHG